MSNIDYTQICPEFYTNYEDGCCMENCTFESKGYCPVRYVKGLLEEKDKRIKELEEQIDKLETQSLIDIDNVGYYQDKYFMVEHQLKVSEKALELACKNSKFEDACEYCAYIGELEITKDCPRWCETDEKFFVTQAMGYFKEQAKEMMKSE